MAYNNPPTPGNSSPPSKPAFRKRRLQADKNIEQKGIDKDVDQGSEQHNAEQPGMNGASSEQEPVQESIEDIDTHKIPIITGIDPDDLEVGDIARQITQQQKALAPVSEPGKEKRGVPVISVRNLSKTYQAGKETSVKALRSVTLDVYPGEFVVVLGPSGSGKSTFMNLIGCLDRPTGGEYWLAGKLVSKLSTDDLADVRNRLIGFVFQGFNLLSRATALKNVALPMVYAGLSRQERENRARKVLKLVGLGARVHHKPSELSGGQQQRVAVARALVNGPSLLLADEPTGNLDSRTSVEIMAVLQALNNQGLTIILVTHDLNVADYARRQVSFLDGAIVRDEMVTNRRFAQDEWAALNKRVAEQTQVKEEPV